MTKPGRSWNGWVFVGVCLVVAVAVSGTGAVRKPAPPPRDDTGTVGAAPAAPEATFGIARAESDTLDLQLD